MTAQRLTTAQLALILAAMSDIPEPDAESLNSPIFKLLASTNREQIAKLLTIQEYGPGEIVFQEGDKGDAMYIIRSGRVAVVKGDFNNPTVLACRGVGEIIGEMALLENAPRSASIVALDKVSFFRIGRNEFQQFLTTNVALGMGILSALSNRLRIADEARKDSLLTEKRLSQRVSELQTEKQQLLELQQFRQETNDLIIHDLRNPLSLIAGAMNLMELSLPAEVIRDNAELLGIVKSNVERMRRLVDSLLDVARIEAGEVQLILTETSIFDMVQHTLEQANTILHDSNINVQILVPVDVPPIKADEEKISRVLANLIDNAVKYTPSGGQISVETKIQGDQLWISVANTGPIIPPEHRKRIFERFTRVKRGKPTTRGFGLGLAFCRLAVEAHGGKIWVEPLENNAGNRFVFTLPLSAQAQSQLQSISVST